MNPTVAIAVLAAALFPPLAAASDLYLSGAIVKDDTNPKYACQPKTIPVMVLSPTGDLPKNPAYQFSMGGGLHVVCARYESKKPPLVGERVRVIAAESHFLVSAI